MHRHALGSADKIGGVDIVLHRPEPDRDVITRFRLRGTSVELALVAENRPFSEDWTHQRYISHPFIFF